MRQTERNWRDNNREKFKESRRNSRMKNPEVYRQSEARKRRRLLNEIWELKNIPCLDCGIKYPPYVMEFDHVRGIKIKAVSQMTSIKGMHEEAKKCEVVCSNCHAIRTWERKMLPSRKYDQNGN